MSIDGQPRLSVKDITPWRGGVALYAEGWPATTFDHVSVYGHALNADLLLESRQTAIGAQFVNDPNGMKEWSITTTDWTPDAATPAQQWYRWDTYGDYQWMTITAKASAAPGELWLVLNGDGKDANSGYRAVLQQADAQHKLHAALFRGATLLAEKELAAPASDAELTVRLRRNGTHLALQLDDQEILTPWKSIRWTGCAWPIVPPGVSR